MSRSACKGDSVPETGKEAELTSREKFNDVPELLRERGNKIKKAFRPAFSRIAAFESENTDCKKLKPNKKDKSG